MSDIVNLLMNSLAANPNDWNVRRAIIEKMLEEGNVSGAAQLVQTAPTSPPDVATAAWCAEIVQGVDPACALRLADQSLATDPSHSGLHFLKANLLLEGRRITGQLPHSSRIG